MELLADMPEPTSPKEEEPKAPTIIQCSPRSYSSSSYSSYDSYTTYDSISSSEGTRIQVQNEHSSVIGLSKRKSNFSTTVTVTHLLGNDVDDQKPTDNGWLTKIFTYIPFLECLCSIDDILDPCLNTRPSMSSSLSVSLFLWVLLSTTAHKSRKVSNPRMQFPTTGIFIYRLSLLDTSYIIDYLDVATEHYEEKLAIINVIFCKTDFSRRTIRVSLFLLLSKDLEPHLGCHRRIPLHSILHVQY